MNRDEYYLAVQKNSQELQHAWLRKGAQAKNHKYYARVELPRRSGSKTSNYRYFYTKEEFDAYENRDKMNYPGKSMDNVLEKNGFTKVSDYNITNDYQNKNKTATVAMPKPKGAPSSAKYVRDTETGVVSSKYGSKANSYSYKGYVRNDELDNPNSDYNLYIKSTYDKVDKYIKEAVEIDKGRSDEASNFSSNFKVEGAKKIFGSLGGFANFDIDEKQYVNNLYKAYAEKYRKDNTLPKKIAKTVSKLVSDTKTKVSELVDAYDKSKKIKEIKQLLPVHTEEDFNRVVKTQKTFFFFKGKQYFLNSFDSFEDLINTLYKERY